VKASFTEKWEALALDHPVRFRVLARSRYRKEMREKEFTMTFARSASRSEDRLSLQEAPLESERYLPRVMPAVFGSGDLTALLIVNVFWVSNVTPISAAGPVTFLYWAICAVGFFVPCSLVMAQLAAVLPHEGGVYNWTWHCLGKTWAFFVTLCTCSRSLSALAPGAHLSTLEESCGCYLYPIRNDHFVDSLPGSAD
jgi:hypothetical protein